MACDRLEGNSIQESTMANKEQRGNREKRKPKKKPKPAPHISSFSAASAKPTAGKKSPG